jgi:hypothetical protein
MKELRSVNVLAVAFPCTASRAEILFTWSFRADHLIPGLQYDSVQSAQNTELTTGKWSEYPDSWKEFHV